MHCITGSQSECQGSLAVHEAVQRESFSILYIYIFTIGLFDRSIELDIIDNLYIMSILNYYVLLKENSGIDPLKLFDPFH